MLRTSWGADSSSETNRARSPRSHAATAAPIAMLVLPVPAVPLIIVVVPRKTPPPSISSRRGMPNPSRSPLASRSSSSWPIGMTARPVSVIRKGNSLVACAEPRYFATRSRRVETSSVTRWSSTTTQSDTYSSMPWRVSVSTPRSPVTTTVTSRCFSHRSSRPNSRRTVASSGSAAKSTSIVSSTTRRAETESIA